jgi:CubicO group peptidase (beta-lactamase class C family)
VYSNFGYGLLGLVVERVDGRGYTEYVQQEIFGGTHDDVFLARSLPGDRDPREPWYSDPFRTCSAFVIATCEQVAYADGGYFFEGFDSYGGLVASAPAVLQFMRNYRLQGTARPANDPGYNGWFFGSINGTHTLARQRTDGTAFVVLFNQRYDSSGLSYHAIREVIDAVVDQIDGWP